MFYDAHGFNAPCLDLQDCKNLWHKNFPTVFLLSSIVTIDVNPVFV